MLKTYFKIAWRNLARGKIFSIINILGLALGITSCVIIFLITRFELSYDKFHPGAEHIYRLVTEMVRPTGEKDYLPMVPDPAPSALRNEMDGLGTVAAFHTIYANVTVANGKDVKKFEKAKFGTDVPEIILAEQQYFEIFQYQWLAGNPSVMSGPYKVVLTESKAHKYFGDLPIDQIIGKEIIYKDSLRFTVAGIVKDLEKNSDFTFTDFLSYATVRQHVFNTDEVNLDNWMFWRGSSQAFVKLNKDVQPETVRGKLTALVNKNIQRDDGTKVTCGLQPLADVHFNSLYENDLYLRKAHMPTLYALIGIAAFILIIAIINFINLSTAQSVRRTKEIGIRKVLGSNKKDLVFQFLIETFVLTLVAICVAIVLAPPVLTVFKKYIPNGVVLTISDPWTIIFLAVVCIFTSLLTGFYPARVLSSYRPVNGLKGKGFEKVNRKSYLRKALIVFQFTASLIFIISSLVIGDQIHFVLNKDLGFNKDAIINLSPGENYGGGKAKVFAEKAMQLTGVQFASADIGTPTDKDHWNTNVQCKQVNIASVDAQMLGGDENYLPLYQLKLLAGRNISNSDTMKEFLINETLSKQLGFKKPEDAIGKIMETGMTDGDESKQCPIVGVIADFHTQSLHEPIKPAFIIESKLFCNSISIKLSNKGKSISDFNSTIKSIEKIWKEIYPNEKFDYSFFDQTIAQFYEKEEKVSGIINLAMTIAVLISCVGLFGLSTFTTQQRIKEIGIRKVLGASVSSIVSLLSKDFLKPVLLALIIASPIAWYFMNKWLQDFAYRISISWRIFCIAALSVLLIALIAVGYQTIRAAIANPVKSLRTE